MNSMFAIVANNFKNVNLKNYESSKFTLKLRKNLNDTRGSSFIFQKLDQQKNLQLINFYFKNDDAFLGSKINNNNNNKNDPITRIIEVRK